MHAFSLLIGSILGHAWSCAVVAKAQKVVSYFRASHRPLALLTKEALHLQINATPVTSNTTRFTSVHLCLESLRKLEAAFNAVLEKEKSCIANKEVRCNLQFVLLQHFYPGSDFCICARLPQAAEAIEGCKDRQAYITKYDIL